MSQEEQAKKMQKVIAKAWSDEGFKQKLIANPRTALNEEGVKTPSGVQLHVVENTDKVQYIVLPPKPTELEFSDQRLALAKVAYPSDNSGISFLSGHCGWEKITGETE